MGDQGSITVLERFPGEGNGNPLQYSCLENSMHRILGGYSPWGCKELDRTERLTLSLCYYTAVQYLPVWVFIHPYHFSPIDKHLDYFFFFFLHVYTVNAGLLRCVSSKELPYNAGDAGSIPGLGRSPGEGNGNPLQYSCLGNPMDREAW